ncbi:8844_t:CDS:1, partial [Diversispora eburnea]
MSDPLTNPSLPLPSPHYQQHLQNEENNDNSLIDLNGWSVVESWKNENFQMNEHQTGYLTNMYASEIISHLYLG